MRVNGASALSSVVVLVTMFEEWRTSSPPVLLIITLPQWAIALLAYMAGDGRMAAAKAMRSATSK
ncbi:MAG TPA: hypothetical protein VGP72_31475 [Planctomycetota bacterium]|jgi:hypothetical protein